MRSNDNLISPIPCTSLPDRIGAADMFHGNVRIQTYFGCILEADSCTLAAKSLLSLRCHHQPGTSFDSQRETAIERAALPIHAFVFFSVFFWALHGLLVLNMFELLSKHMQLLHDGRTQTNSLG